MLWAAKEEDVAVRICELEASKAVGGIFEWRAECESLRSEFVTDSVRIGRVDESVPTEVMMARVVGNRRDAGFGFNEELRAFASDDGKPWGVRFPEANLEAEFVTVEGDGAVNV
jgi:hypothetical protein